MRKKSVIVLMFVGLLALLMTACNGSDSDGSIDSSDSMKANEIASVIVGLDASITSLDPANHRDRTTESVLRNIYDGLVKITDDGEVEGLIAESWENPSPTEWVFKIKDGIKFHEGSDLTVDDVVFTFERIINEGAMGGETSPRQGLLGTLEKVEAVDDSHVKFTFESPWPIFLKMLPHQQIVPKAYLEEVGDEEFRNNPIGSGPFKFVEGNLDERIVLERFDDYHGGAAKIKHLVFDVIPELSSRVSALQAGEVHRIVAVSPAIAEELLHDDNVEVKNVNSTRAYMLEMNVEMEPFDNPQVRKAMNHAINMDTIIGSIFGEYVERLPGPMLTDSFAHHDGLEFYEYDPEKAKQILVEEGYGDGFSVVIDTEDMNKEVAEAIANNLREIGIDANTRIWDMAVLREMLLDGERQMFLGSWGNSSLDPYDFLNPKLKTGDRGNYSQYSNPRLDELLEAGDVELDEAKREEIYLEAQEIIYEDAPWVFGFTLSEIEAGHKSLQNWSPRFDGMIYMDEATLVE